MSLDVFPDEIVEIILRHLAPSLRLSCKRAEWTRELQDITDEYRPESSFQLALIQERRLVLSQASRTCKRLRRIVLPILYGTIEAAPLKLLLVLAEKEELASLVKAIDLNQSLPELEKDRVLLWEALCIGRLSRLPHRIKHQLCGIIDLHYQNISSGEHVFGANHAALRLETGPDISWYYEAAPQIMYLLLLPNLEHIANLGHGLVADDVSVNFLRQTGEFSAASTHGSSRSEFFLPAPPRVKALRWFWEPVCHAAGDVPDLSYFKDLIQPTVVRIEAFYMNWWATGGDPLLGLQQIDLLDTIFHTSSQVPDLLRRCPDLQSLKIRSAYYGDRVNLDWMELGSALRQYGRGLIHLALDLGGLGGLALDWGRAINEYCPFYRKHDGWTGGKLGSLRPLSRLRSLVLNQDIMLALPTESYKDTYPFNALGLTLDQCLPDSLEHVTLLSPPELPYCYRDEMNYRAMTEEEIEIESEAIHQQAYELIQAKDRQKNLRQVRMCWEGFKRETESWGFRTENKQVRSLWSGGVTCDQELSVTDVVRMI